MGFIEDFYNGEHNPQKGIFNYNSEVCEAYEKMVKTEEALLSNLKGEFLEQFRAYVDSSTDFYGMSHIFSYKKGFRDGARFANDVYADD